MLHFWTVSDIQGMELLRLKTEVDQQFDLQTTDMSINNFYLMDRDKETLLNKPVEVIGGVM